MKHIVIKKEHFKSDDLIKDVTAYLYKDLKDADTYVFDIHNTIEYEDGFDKDIVKFIEKNHEKYNIVLLSFDGNDERIVLNSKKLDKHNSIFEKIHKIFIKKRRKHYILGIIHELIESKFKKYRKMVFVDDNYKNIKDAKKFKKKSAIKELKIVHYTAHTDRKSDIGIEKLGSILQ